MSPWRLTIFMFATITSFATSDFQITSPKFHHGEVIPKVYSCYGDNLSPPLAWVHPPKNTKAYVLFVVDYDAEKVVGHTVYHWNVLNIPAAIHALPAGTKGIITGLNSYGEFGYRGVCPPPGETHQYFFQLYALNQEELVLPRHPTVLDVSNAMQNHIIDEASMRVSFTG